MCQCLLRSHFIMNLNNKRRTPYFTQLKDPKLDCPNKDCSGWLILYGIPGIPRPVPSFMQCSNKSHVDPSLRCSQPTIFSKRTSSHFTDAELLSIFKVWSKASSNSPVGAVGLNKLLPEYSVNRLDTAIRKFKLMQNLGDI